jgi:hypothetical protein
MSASELPPQNVLEIEPITGQKELVISAEGRIVNGKTVDGQSIAIITGPTLRVLFDSVENQSQIVIGPEISSATIAYIRNGATIWVPKLALLGYLTLESGSMVHRYNPNKLFERLQAGEISIETFLNKLKRRVYATSVASSSSASQTSNSRGKQTYTNNLPKQPQPKDKADALTILGGIQISSSLLDS